LSPHNVVRLSKLPTDYLNDTDSKVDPVYMGPRLSSSIVFIGARSRHSSRPGYIAPLGTGTLEYDREKGTYSWHTTTHKVLDVAKIPYFNYFGTFGAAKTSDLLVAAWGRLYSFDVGGGMIYEVSQKGFFWPRWSVGSRFHEALESSNDVNFPNFPATWASVQDASIRFGSSVFPHKVFKLSMEGDVESEDWRPYLLSIYSHLATNCTAAPEKACKLHFTSVTWSKEFGRWLFFVGSGINEEDSERANEEMATGVGGRSGCVSPILVSASRNFDDIKSQVLWECLRAPLRLLRCEGIRGSNHLLCLVQDGLVSYMIVLDLIDFGSPAITLMEPQLSVGSSTRVQDFVLWDGFRRESSVEHDFGQAKSAI